MEPEDEEEHERELGSSLRPSLMGASVPEGPGGALPYDRWRPIPALVPRFGMSPRTRGSRTLGHRGGGGRSMAPEPPPDRPEDLLFCKGPWAGLCELCSEACGTHKRLQWLQRLRPTSSNGLRTIRHCFYSVFMVQFVLLGLLVLQFAADASRRGRCSASLLVWSALSLTFATHSGLHRAMGPLFRNAMRMEGAEGSLPSDSAAATHELPEAGCRSRRLMLCLACVQQLLAALGALGLLASAVLVAAYAGLDVQELLIAGLWQDKFQPRTALATGSPSADGSATGSARPALRGSAGGEGSVVATTSKQEERVVEFGVGIHFVALVLAIAGTLLCLAWGQRVSRHFLDRERSALRAERQAFRQNIHGAVLSFAEIVEAHRPSPQAVARSVPAIIEQQKVVTHQVEAECSICAEELDGQLEIRRAQCGHYFHSECLRTWLLRSPTCPLCRKDLMVQYEARRLENEFARLMAGGLPIRLPSEENTAASA